MCVNTRYVCVQIQDMYVCKYKICECVNTRYVYRVATTNMMPYLYRSFPAKEPYY